MVFFTILLPLLNGIAYILKPSTNDLYIRAFSFLAVVFISLFIGIAVDIVVELSFY